LDLLACYLEGHDLAETPGAKQVAARQNHPALGLLYYHRAGDRMTWNDQLSGEQDIEPLRFEKRGRINIKRLIYRQ
jgi:hypothetical protein